MLQRFLIYGVAGWVIEVLFTGLGDFLESGDPALKARTHFWMFPICGVAALLMESVYRGLPEYGFWARGPLYVGIMFAVEYLSGALLFHSMKARPWDYTDRGWHIHGFIRLDYAPFWLFAGWIFERVYPRLLALPDFV